ncbi:ABC transporter related protein [Coriobacterium glomerans PW2]|uniref:ABC transporter related protein n=1 Tax=Coriobacterium glomerans (strain ATCC 49209 / DSM 20642 / JCM 10262 / PW2) TaxID=700015 RepID=F2NAG3_CORGP|nr:ABC transporter ATP-binding protein [Coriobacterium glomerans]AEB06490.1 ABC transporter related protein [Coriobacterium glomerans PW2]
MRCFLRLLKPYRLESVAVLCALAINLAGVLLVPTFLSVMINAGISTRDLDTIMEQGALMLASAIISGAAAFACNYLCADLSSKIGRDIRNAVYDRSLEFSGGDFEEFGCGSMITRTLGDVNVIQMAITMTIQMMLPVPFAAVIGIALAMRIDAYLGTLLACFIVVVGILAVLTASRAARIFQKLQGFVDRMNVRLRESITGVRVIRAFGKERAEQRSLDESFMTFAMSAIRVNWLFATLDCSTFLIMNLAEVAIIWVGANRVGAHAMQIASISACVEYAMLILFFIMMAQITALTLPRALVCFNRCRSVIEHDLSIRDKTGAKTCAEHGDERAIDTVARFVDVSFRFADADEDTLHELNFSCRRTTTTAIIGQTGSGKSTIAKLLLRLHEITGGSLQVNGCDVREMSQHELREHVSYVPQKAWLFSGTIADNLRLGRPDATEADMWHALEVAQAGFVHELDGGLDAPVSQGGSNLSGGQRQRISIARALIKPADLYIFDDSFSALDFKTDSALRSALVPEMRTAAVLIIAQRINTILHADQIVVLDEGRIAGIGAHDDLMRTCDTYREIANSQLRASEIDGLGTGVRNGVERHD